MLAEFALAIVGLTIIGLFWWRLEKWHRYFKREMRLALKDWLGDEEKEQNA